MVQHAITAVSALPVTYIQHATFVHLHTWSQDKKRHQTLVSNQRNKYYVTFAHVGTATPLPKMVSCQLVTGMIVSAFCLLACFVEEPPTTPPVRAEVPSRRNKVDANLTLCNASGIHRNL